MRYTYHAVTLLWLLLVHNAHPEVCRGKISLPPHQQSLWQADFPNPNVPIPLCDGSIGIDAEGSICVTGRVSYKQIAEAVQKPIFAPAAETISINGHLLTGSGNVVLGSDAGMLYDFVKTYTVNGKQYTANSTMADMLIAASRGTIDGVCLKSTFVQDSAFYKVEHDFYLPSFADLKQLNQANIIFAGHHSLIAEYHIPASRPLISGHLSMGLITFFSSLAPAFTLQIFPLLGLAGIFRLFIGGTMDTSKYPQPLTSPSISVENVQLNTEWTTLMTAMQNGLFTTNNVPLYFGVVIKQITPKSGNSCWSKTIAAIDFQAPQTWGSDLDQYIANEVYPILEQYGTVDIHLGKRIDEGSALLTSAWKSYKNKCGVQLDVNPANCYHPVCRRTTQVEDFQYPPTYFAGLKGQEPSQSPTKPPSQSPTHGPTEGPTRAPTLEPIGFNVTTSDSESNVTTASGNENMEEPVTRRLWSSLTSLLY